MVSRLHCTLWCSWLMCSVAAANSTADLEDYAVVALQAPASRGETVLTVEAFQQRWKLTIRDHTAPFSRLEPSRRQGIREGGSRYMTGEVEGRPGSWVRLNWTSGRWWGGFHDGRTLYLIDRAGGFRWETRKRPASEQDLVFRLEDLNLSDIIGHDPLEPLKKRAATAGSSEARSTASRSLPVTIITDTAFQSTHGADADAIVAGRINFVDGIYASQVGTGIVLDHVEALASDGALTPTDAVDLLYAFQDYMTAGDGSDIPFEGLAHLFTSRSRDGSTAGIAFLGVLCSSFAGFGVDWDTSSETTNSLVLAHEFGHNFAAPHDGQGACADETFEGIMNASINGSEEFSRCSLSQMQPEVDSASCLIATPNAGLIFSDGFRLFSP